MKLSDFPLEYTTAAEHPFPYINQWITDQFPDLDKRKQFLMFLSTIARGEKLDQAYIIKYFSQLEETYLVFFITLIAGDNARLYSFEKELPGMTWIKDAGAQWTEDAITFKPQPLISHNIYAAAKDWSSFCLWLSGASYWAAKADDHNPLAEEAFDWPRCFSRVKARMEELGTPWDETKRLSDLPHIRDFAAMNGAGKKFVTHYWEIMKRYGQTAKIAGYELG